MIKSIYVMKRLSCAIIMLLLLVCCTEEDYKSPLKDISVSDISFGYSADSCLINIKNARYSDYVFTVSESWCTVYIIESSLFVKCTENNTYRRS